MRWVPYSKTGTCPAEGVVCVIDGVDWPTGLRVAGGAGFNVGRP